MKCCSCLFYATTPASVELRWRPWECGYFDGRNGRTAKEELAFFSKNLHERLARNGWTLVSVKPGVMRRQKAPPGGRRAQTGKPTFQRSARKRKRGHGVVETSGMGSQGSQRMVACGLGAVKEEVDIIRSGARSRSKMRPPIAMSLWKSPRPLRGLWSNGRWDTHSGGRANAR